MVAMILSQSQIVLYAYAKYLLIQLSFYLSMLSLSKLTHPHLDKMDAILQTTFSNAFFHEWKFLYFDLNFIEVCSQASNWR